MNTPEEHLLKHAVGGGHTWRPACGKGVQLQVGGDELCGHLGVCSRSCSTAAEQQQFDIHTHQWPISESRFIDNSHFLVISGKLWVCFKNQVQRNSESVPGTTDSLK